MSIKNAYTTSPQDVKVGDQFLFVLKAIVIDEEHFRVYRCRWEPPGSPIIERSLSQLMEEDLPQGDSIYGDSIGRDIFPVLGNAGFKHDVLG